MLFLTDAFFFLFFFCVELGIRLDLGVQRFVGKVGLNFIMIEQYMILENFDITWAVLFSEVLHFLSHFNFLSRKKLQRFGTPPM